MLTSWIQCKEHKKGFKSWGYLSVGDLSTARVRTSEVNSYTSLAVPHWNTAITAVAQSAFLRQPLALRTVAHRERVSRKETVC